MDVVMAAGLEGTKRGHELYYRAPYRSDENPSLRVDPEKDCWFDDPAGMGGTAWQLAAAVAGVDPADKPAMIEWLSGRGLHNTNGKASGRVVDASYPYTDEAGELLYEVVRYYPKDFRQRRPDGNGGWIPNLEGVRRVLYRLPELVSHEAEYINICEGEKDADALVGIGLIATTIPGGKKWRPEYTESFRADQHVCVLPDNDDPGRERAEVIAEALSGKVASVRIVNLPNLPHKGDVSDWLNGRDPFEAGEELSRLADNTDEWRPLGTSVLPANSKRPERHGDPYVPSAPPDSFVSRYVDYAAQRTDAPLPAHELVAVGLLSALAGPGPRLPLAVSVNGCSLCVWTLYVVNSTSGRKTTVIDSGLDIAAEVLGRDALMFWEGSPQGIIQRLQTRDGQPAIFARDEYSGLLSQMNRGGHMAGLAQLFIRTYDGAPLENIRTRKKNKNTGELEDDVDRVERPYLVKLCASTWDSFTTRATIDNVLDGFLARFVVYTGSSKPRRMQKLTPELTLLRESLLEHAKGFRRKCESLGFLKISNEALDLAWELEQEWTARADDCSRPDAAGPALKRLSESVLRVAGLLAIDDAAQGTTPEILAAHFRAARAMGDRWVDCTLRLIDALGRTGFQQDCEAVLGTIRRYPDGVRIRDIYRRHRKLKKREFDEVLCALETQGEIESRESESRKGPASRWVVPTGEEVA